jgi:hypothetical protein
LLNKACGAKHSRVQVQRQRFDQQHAHLGWLLLPQGLCSAPPDLKILARTSVDCWAVRFRVSEQQHHQANWRPAKKMTPAFPCSFLYLPTLLCPYGQHLQKQNTVHSSSQHFPRINHKERYPNHNDLHKSHQLVTTE